MAEHDRRPAPEFFPVAMEIFSDPRFATLAVERGEIVQTVWGRTLGAWGQAYRSRTADLTREQIQMGAGLPLRGPWFADQLVDSYLATRTEDGLYQQAGVAKRLKTIEDSYRLAVESGRKGAAKRWGAHRPPIGFDGRDRDIEEEDHRCARSSSPPPSEIQISSVPTETDQSALDPGVTANIPANAQPEPERIVLPPDDRLVGDPELNDWLVGEMRVRKRGFTTWLRSHAGGDVVRLEAMLRVAESKWLSDERIALKKEYQGAPPTAWLNTFLEIEAKKYASSPAPPLGGAAIISLSEAKAEAEDDVKRRNREAELRRKQTFEENAVSASALSGEDRAAILERARAARLSGFSKLGEGAC